MVGEKRSKHILSIFAVKIVLELTLTRSFDVVMVCFFSLSFLHTLTRLVLLLLVYFALFLPLFRLYLCQIVSLFGSNGNFVCVKITSHARQGNVLFLFTFLEAIEEREKKILFAICFMKFPLKSIC